MTNPNHCGGCDQKCPVIEHGESTCQNGGCKLACKTDYRACGGKCTVVTDPNACGPSCTPCPVPPNTTAATCAADTCGYAACSANYGNCNNNAADGCETNLQTDALNCGTCGKSCNGQTCTAGVCDAPPPPPPPDGDAGP